MSRSLGLSLLSVAATVSFAAANCNNIQGACTKANILAANCNLVNSNTPEETVEAACNLGGM